MKVKALIASAGAALAILVPATTASAHPTSWYWTPQAIANDIYTSNLHWRSGAVDTVTYVSCRGTGRSYRGGFKHFRCYVESLEDAPFVIRVHILGRNSYSFRFRFYA